jgi:hypothetical protein
VEDVGIRKVPARAERPMKPGGTLVFRGEIMLRKDKKRAPTAASRTAA